MRLSKQSPTTYRTQPVRICLAGLTFLLTFAGSPVFGQETSADVAFWTPVVDSVGATEADFDHPVQRGAPFGPVVAWGWDFYGQSSGGMSPPFDAIQVAAGRDHTVALRESGAVEAWGSNSSGQTGVPSELPPVKQIAAGFYFTLAQLEDGSLTGWGDWGQGQLDIPEDLGTVAQIDGGYDFSVALQRDGTVRAWGGNQWGQLNIPEGLDDVVQIAASERHVVALKSNGSLVMWGDQTWVPSGLGEVIAIAGGYHRTAALTTDGLHVWSSGSVATIPVESAYVDHFSLGAGFLLIRYKTGHIDVWGSNPYGPLQPPPGLPYARHVATGAFHSIAAIDPERPKLAQVFPRDNNLTTVIGSPYISSLYVYPNPIENHATIAFVLGEYESVSIEAFDAAGRRVDIVFEDRLLPGTYEIAWSPSGLPPGVYAIRVRAGAQSYATTITVMGLSTP